MHFLKHFFFWQKHFFTSKKPFFLELLAVELLTRKWMIFIWVIWVTCHVLDSDKNVVADGSAYWQHVSGVSVTWKRHQQIQAHTTELLVGSRSWPFTSRLDFLIFSFLCVFVFPLGRSISSQLGRPLQCCWMASILLLTRTTHHQQPYLSSLNIFGETVLI